MFTSRLRRAEELLKAALEEIAKLKERLNRNSKNSSKSPSTDQKPIQLIQAKNHREVQRKEKRAILFLRIDKLVQCTQENCPHCGSSKVRLTGQPS